MAASPSFGERNCILAVLVIFCFGSLAMCKEKKENMHISIGQAVEKANTKAIQLGYDVSTMTVSADENNAKWRQFTGRVNLRAHLPDISKQITGKEYFAVYYRPKIEQLGGDLWIFINRNNGEVLGIWRGK
ncbi:MAG: hypothetical protein HY543_00740 [Deltaproteobacteria bacterium]|nr:hypothetical protein [Deltaproteobacteria bacterium]